MRREGSILHISDIDVIDGTPLLDIKPYVPEFDVREVSRIGWLEGKADRARGARPDGRALTGPGTRSSIGAAKKGDHHGNIS